MTKKVIKKFLVIDVIDEMFLGNVRNFFGNVLKKVIQKFRRKFSSVLDPLVALYKIFLFYTFSKPSSKILNKLSQFLLVIATFHYVRLTDEHLQKELRTCIMHNIHRFCTLS